MTAQARSVARRRWARRLAAGAALALVCAWMPARALAQWVVWEPPNGDGELAREVVSICAERGIPATLDPTASFAGSGGDVGEDEVRWLASADREVALAREELASLDEQAALARLDRLLESTTAHPHVPGVVARRVEALLLRATVAASRGQTASEDFAEVARLDAERRLAAGEAPPAVREQADDARALALSSTGVLEVAPTAPGAEVFLDDVSLGPAPIRVGPIAAGRHVLRVEAPAHETYGAWIDVTAGERPAWVPELTPVAELRGWRSATAALRAGRVARSELPWSWLFVRGGARGRVAARACTGSLDRCSEWVRSTRSAFVMPDEPPTAWSSTRTPTTIEPTVARWLAGPRGAPRRPARPRPARWYERPWIWALATTVVVGAGVTAGVVAATGDSSRPRVFAVSDGMIDVSERD
ncbi:MAG: PEGA domain-containing protein [Deltaproteobacteria bacterium]|nr:PEGA domain-containing protein [Deltaproteobacteria bacterium]